MFGISGEHLIILFIILIIFGPKRLPELGNTLGKAMKNFKDSLSGIEEAKFRHLTENKPSATDPAAPVVAAEPVVAPTDTAPKKNPEKV